MGIFWGCLIGYAIIGFFAGGIGAEAYRLSGIEGLTLGLFWLPVLLFNVFIVSLRSAKEGWEIISAELPSFKFREKPKYYSVVEINSTYRDGNQVVFNGTLDKCIRHQRERSEANHFFQSYLSET